MFCFLLLYRYIIIILHIIYTSIETMFVFLFIPKKKAKAKGGGAWLGGGAAGRIDRPLKKLTQLVIVFKPLGLSFVGKMLV